MAYLGFHKGGKFLLPTSVYTKGGQIMFSYFFLWRKKFLPRGHGPIPPLNTLLASLQCKRKSTGSANWSLTKIIGAWTSDWWPLSFFADMICMSLEGAFSFWIWIYFVYKIILNSNSSLSIIMKASTLLEKNWENDQKYCNYVTHITWN